ncbi:hypothetical protein KM1_297070 [Entamoeba histolytica HM-3:IMSS]|uniref:Uncharacterized protein n=3 Tax=Entamoeba histolytica TaxID=5759 RepID=M7X158_ENTHI|nr:Hypothetical protein EHI5A_235660 [Entamoeba histolytica KU27]EMS14777.1 hypothetical protein KM1_311800 [Entamoeba histolytica HM-3:IMSS]EMS17409.1 hypothetical protein KM1_297070 [Entamoeba histolytica HM-3:IMSS]ENY61984.1 unknown protein, putative [Entamoeba histolytica HM-1:IMSS-A]
MDNYTTKSDNGIATVVQEVVADFSVLQQKHFNVSIDTANSILRIEQLAKQQQTWIA